MAMLRHVLNAINKESDVRACSWEAGKCVMRSHVSMTAFTTGRSHVGKKRRISREAVMASRTLTALAPCRVTETESFSNPLRDRLFDAPMSAAGKKRSRASRLAESSGPLALTKAKT